jgi:ABC-type sugar transport system permease subunit
VDTYDSKRSVLFYVGPAMLLLFVLLVYPTLDTIRLSFMDRHAEQFVGLANYRYVISSPRMQEAIGNNLLWLVVFTVATVGFGLIIAVLADRVRYEALAKSIIFLPMAISFVGAGVIWKFVYDLNPPGTPVQPQPQIGLLNAILVGVRPDGTLSDVITGLDREGIPVERQAVVDSIVQTETEALNAAVADGSLSQESSDSLMAALPQAASNYLNGQIPAADAGWQTVGVWGREAVTAINDALAAAPEGSGRAICNVVPYACVSEIQDVEEAALETAVEDGTLSETQADVQIDSLPMVALNYVQRGQRPTLESWQTLDQWDQIIANTREINIRSLNSSLDTGAEPIDWIRQPPANNIALIIVGVWIWTGFCMVVLSAALKSIPAELFEAARVDGANEIQAFFRITIPLLMPTLTVVTTTMIITVLKVFDIVYVMTAGNFGTEVIANRMYQEMYGGDRNFGYASAIAVILMLAIVPIMLYNIAQFRRQEGQR